MSKWLYYNQMNLTVDARQIITSPLSEKNISVLLYCKYKQGDGVAERIKASVFLRISQSVRREVPPSRTLAWQIPTGAH